MSTGGERLRCPCSAAAAFSRGNADDLDDLARTVFVGVVVLAGMILIDKAWWRRTPIRS